MRNIIICILLVSLMLLSTACGTSIYANYREIENLQLIQTIGIDTTQDGVRLTVTSGQGTSGSKPFVISHDGESVVTAIENMQEYSQRDDMFYAHVQYAILGQKAAMEGIGRYLDYFERAPYIRLDIGMFIVHEAVAEDIIVKSSSDKTDITEYLSELERLTETTGISKIFTAKEISRSLSEKGSALICAVNLAPTENIVHTETAEMVAEPIGYGLVVGDKLEGYILDDTAKGVSILLGETQIGSLLVETDRKYTLSLESDGAKISPRWSTTGDLEAIEISCDISSAVSEIDSLSPDFTAESVLDLEKATAEKIKNYIELGFATQAEFEADFLGLGETLRRDNAENYAKIEDNFFTAISNAKLEIDVVAQIDKSIDMRVPTEPRGE